VKKYIQLSMLPVCILLSLLSCAQTEQQLRRLPVNAYLDKMKAGWVGQMVGVGWGGPTEFKFKGEIIPPDQIPEWQPGMVNQHYQDDIYVEMTFLRTLELYGFDVSPSGGADCYNGTFNDCIAHTGRDPQQ